MIKQILFISDLHAGCQYGLMPPGRHTLDGEGYCEPSPLQLKVYDWWTEFWEEWVPYETEGEPYAIVVNGDTTDGRHHGATTQVSQNLKDQRRIAQRLLEPIVDKCKGNFYMVRGTECHVGLAAENEETLGEILKAKKNGTSNHTHWELWLRLGGEKGTLIHALHHIGTTGSMHYESTAAMKELSEAYAEAGRWKNNAPDVIVRSHRHRHIEVSVPTENGKGIATITPGWQLKTPLVYRIAGGRSSLPQFGGVLVRKGSKGHYTREKVFDIDRPKEVVV